MKLHNVFRLRIKMSVSFSKSSIKLQFMLILKNIFIFLTILRINNNSFASANQTIKKENEFNIIAFADLGCLSPLNNIKNIVKLDPKFFLVVRDLRYNKSYHHRFTITLIFDSTKIDYFTIVEYCKLMIIYSI